MRRPLAIIVPLGVLVLGVLLAAGYAGPLAPGPAGVIALERLARCGWIVGVYVLGAYGVGRLASPLFRASERRGALQLGAGLALMLSASHGLGVLGLLAGRAGVAMAWTPIALGIALALHQHRGAIRRIPRSAGASRVPPSIVLLDTAAALGAAILLLAALQPPGALWDSEFAGYDALSYHLQLPQEWIGAGAVAPLAHNVYSYLPSYVESAFVHVAALTGAPQAPDRGGTMGLLAGTGWRAVSCQLLHAAMMLIAAGLAGALARRAASMAGASDASRAGVMARALVLVTPWPVVVGSLAYNEMAMVALLAGALLGAASTEIGPARRAALVALLVGAACGCKPTALILGAPGVAILLLALATRREWPRIMFAGALVGAATIAPWLVRNALAGGNPVFPALTGLFGRAHWTLEQVDRFARAHQFHGSLGERLALAVFPDRSDPSGPRHRGVMHPQWALFFPIVALAAGHAAFWLKGPGRRVAVALALGLLAQLVAWLLGTHIQSRFLLPLLAGGAALVGLAASAPAKGSTGAERSLATRAGALMSVGAFVAIALQLAQLARVWSAERQGRPNVMLAFEPSDLTARALATLEPGAAEALAGAAPAVGVARHLARGERLRLLAVPTAFYFPPGTRYQSVWDAWPFDASGFTDPEARHVLVGVGAMHRFERSGYLPEGLTPELVESWIARRTTVVASWPHMGMDLVRVTP